MQPVRNVHARHIDAPIERVRPWIEACWSGGDRDCFPRDVIPTWRKNPSGGDPRALIPGETMLGHGPFRFRLSAWDGVVWRVDVVGRPAGWHQFELRSDGGGTVLTHTLELELAARLGWMTIEPIHDWAVEALFDRLEHALRTGVVPARTERPMSRVAALALRVARRNGARRRRNVVEASSMERLPAIDEYVEHIEASRELVWAALLTTVRDAFPRSVPRVLSAAWGLRHTTRVGGWTTKVGDTTPGFIVAENDPTRLLTLRGRHRFSRYELRFELDSPSPGRVDVHAKTYATFPGVHGRIYRALVIGTGGHGIVVRRLLAGVARRSSGPPPHSP